MRKSISKSISNSKSLYILIGLVALSIGILLYVQGQEVTEGYVDKYTDNSGNTSQTTSENTFQPSPLNDEYLVSDKQPGPSNAIQPGPSNAIQPGPSNAIQPGPRNAILLGPRNAAIQLGPSNAIQLVPSNAKQQPTSKNTDVSYAKDLLNEAYFSNKEADLDIKKAIYYLNNGDINNALAAIRRHDAPSSLKKAKTILQHWYR